MRTLNGEVLIDEQGNLNEQTWLNSLLAVAELLGEAEEKRDDKSGSD